MPRSGTPSVASIIGQLSYYPSIKLGDSVQPDVFLGFLPRFRFLLNVIEHAHEYGAGTPLRESFRREVRDADGLEQEVVVARWIQKKTGTVWCELYDAMPPKLKHEL